MIEKYIITVNPNSIRWCERCNVTKQKQRIESKHYELGSKCVGYCDKCYQSEFKCNEKNCNNEPSILIWVSSEFNDYCFFGCDMHKLKNYIDRFPIHEQIDIFVRHHIISKIYEINSCF